MRAAFVYNDLLLGVDADSMCFEITRMVTDDHAAGLGAAILRQISTQCMLIFRYVFQFSYIP